MRAAGRRVVVLAGLRTACGEDLSKPALRARMELAMTAIARGEQATALLSVIKPFGGTSKIAAYALGCSQPPLTPGTPQKSIQNWPPTSYC